MIVESDGIAPVHSNFRTTQEDDFIPLFFPSFRDEPPPPSYDEVMGIATNWGQPGFAASVLPTNGTPPCPAADPSEAAVTTASPDGGNLFYMDFIPKIKLTEDPEMFR